jgi:hypothetical protein
VDGVASGDVVGRVEGRLLLCGLVEGRWLRRPREVDHAERLPRGGRVVAPCGNSGEGKKGGRGLRQACGCTLGVVGVGHPLALRPGQRVLELRNAARLTILIIIFSMSSRRSSLALPACATSS